MTFSPKAGINEKPLGTELFRDNNNTHRGPMDHHPQGCIMNELIVRGRKLTNILFVTFQG